MLFLDATEITKSLHYKGLIEALRIGLRADIITPARQAHTVAPPTDILLLMPSFRLGERIGIKLTSVFPSNLGQNLPMIHAIYALIDGKTGQTQAILDGTALTRRRTAALAALATGRLSNQIGGTLLIMGTGALSEAMIEAHLALCPWRKIKIWGRSESKMLAVSQRLRERGINVEACSEAKIAVGFANVICCATAAETPIILADWVHPGTHINLFGAYLPTMREADSELVTRAALYVDSHAAALEEAGDILIPMREGRFTRAHIRADMRELLLDLHLMPSKGAITVFKSVGFGALDLIAAESVLAISHARG